MDRAKKIQEFLKDSPNDNFLRHALALEYIKDGNDSKARDLFESILTESPEYIGSYYHLAKLLERNDEIDLSVQWYKKGMEAAREVGDDHAYNELQRAYEDLIY
jgi:Tfp pilus assembly protein PilF